MEREEDREPKVKEPDQKPAEKADQAGKKARPKRRMSKPKWELLRGTLIMIIVTLLAFTVYGRLANRTRNSSMENQREAAKLDAQNCSANLERELQAGVSVTEALKDVIVANNGNFTEEDFKNAAALLKENRLYVVGLQMADDGKVNGSYPDSLKRGVGVDLYNDPSTRLSSRYAADHKKVIFRGPLDMGDGKEGFVVQNPVFMQKHKHYFCWGFAIAYVTVPEVFEETDKLIEKSGYVYQLYTTGSPQGKKYKQIYGTSVKLKDPVVYEFKYGECGWKLAMEPMKGWQLGSEYYFVSIGGFFIALFIIAVIGMALRASRLHRTILHIMQHDTLTGVASRKYFSDKAEAFLKKEKDLPCTYVSLDIDDFKLINDVYGHLTGDKALQQMGDCLSRQFHGKDGFAGRMGGDEFAILITGKDREEAKDMVEKLHHTKQVFTDDKGGGHCFTISIGYSDYPAQADNIEGLSRNADAALYEVKLGGKHGLLAYDPSMGKQSRTQLGFNLKDVSKHAPGGFIIYRCNEAEEILYANDIMIHAMGCKNYEDFIRFTKGTFHEILPDEEREKALSTMTRHTDTDEVVEALHYTLVPKEGDPYGVKEIRRLVDHETHGSIFYAFLTREDT